MRWLCAFTDQSESALNLTEMTTQTGCTRLPGFDNPVGPVHPVQADCEGGGDGVRSEEWR